MAIVNDQYLERLAEISQHFGKDEALPDASRQMFSRAFDMANRSLRDDPAEGSVDETFEAVCEACKAAGLRQCKEGENGFLACQLVWDYTS